MKLIKKLTLMLQLQLAVLPADAAFANLRARVVDIAARLSEKDSIPMVREQMPLIQKIQTDEFWQDVTAPILRVSERSCVPSQSRIVDVHPSTTFRNSDIHPSVPGNHDVWPGVKGI